MLNLQPSTIGDLLLVIAMAFFFCISVATTLCCGPARSDTFGLWSYVTLTAFISAIFVLIARPAERLGRWVRVSGPAPRAPDEEVRRRAEQWITVTNVAIAAGAVVFTLVASSDNPSLFPLFVVALGVIAAAAFERARASQRLKPRGARRLAILTDPTRGDVVLLIVSLVVVLTPIVLAAIAIFG